MRAKRIWIGNSIKLEKQFMMVMRNSANRDNETEEMKDPV